MKTTKKIIKKNGRPTALVPETVAKLEAGLKAGFTIEQACVYAGINKATLYRRIKVDEAFATKISQAQAYTTFAAKRNINKAIVDGSVQEAKWWLEKKHPEEFQTQGSMMGIRAGDGKIEVVVVDYK